MSRIFNGDDRARELGYKSYREFVIAYAKRSGFVFDPELGGEPLVAFVSAGRWLAECECGEFYYVSPTDPIGFCHGRCGNSEQGGKSRKIIFPPNRVEIENALLEREITGTITGFNKHGTQTAGLTLLYAPKVAPRNWNGETVEELRAIHEMAKQIIEEVKHGENRLANSSNV